MMSSALRQVRMVLLSAMLIGMSMRAATAQRPASPAATGGMGDAAPIAPFSDLSSVAATPAITVPSFAWDDTPSQCLNAVQVARRQMVRNLGLDTSFGPASIPGPLPPAIRDMGLRCRARLGTTPVPAREVRNAFALAVILDDQPGADKALEQWLASPQMLTDRGEAPVETRIKRITTAIRTYLQPGYFGLPPGVPGPQRDAHVARARALIPRLDSIGPRARLARVAMQELVLETETEWRNQANGSFVDPQRVIRDFTAFLPSIDSVGGIERVSQQYGLGILQTALNLVGARFLIDEKSAAPFADSLVHAMPRLGIIGQLLTIVGNGTRNFGGPVDPVHTQFWYSARGDSVWPVSGHVSLLIRSEVTLWEAAFIRQLMARYGSRGLRISALTKTKGYWDKGGTETGPRTAAQEAAQDSAFYLGYLKLPAALAITESQFRTLPNGWVVPVARKEDDRQGIALADANGHFVLALPSFDPTFLRAYLDRLMGLTAK